MKKLHQYLSESLISLNESVNRNKLIQQLSSNSDLGGYVDYLNRMLDDPDAKSVLISAFVESNDKNAYEFSGKMMNIKVTDLHPTQAEIDVDKSLGYPFKSPSTANACMKMFFESDVAQMPFPLITFDGKFIVDGHHRWSQVYSFNPEAKMECFDLKLKKGGKIDEQDVLKIVQGLLAAKRAEDGKGSLPKSIVEGANLFKMTEKQVKDTITRYCDRDTEVAQIICNTTNTGSIEGLADYLCDNLMKLRKDNISYARKGNNRGIMPQTDRGGDDPDNMDSAKPNTKGSALHKLTHGKIDKDVI